MNIKNNMTMFIIAEFFVCLFLLINISIIDSQDSFIYMNFDGTDNQIYDTTSPYFGVFDYLNVYNGTVKYSKTETLSIENNDSTKLYVQIGSKVYKNMLLGTSDNGDVYSKYDSFIINIRYGNDILIEFVTYDDVYIELSINIDYYQSLLSSEDLYVYTNNSKYFLELSNYYINYECNTYELIYKLLDFEEVLFENEILNLYQTSKSNATIFINNEGLGEKLENNKYLIWVLDPSIESCNPFCIVVEIGRHNEYFTEIVSNNLPRYFEIIIHSK